MKIVEVVWGDAWCSTGEISIKKAEKLKPIQRTSVGFLVAENDEGITLAMDSFEAHPKTAQAHAFIPWGWVEHYWVYQ